MKYIWLIPLQGGEPRQFTRNTRSEHARWSPDGKHLLVVREDRLWLYDLVGGDPRQLTTMEAAEGAFSPSGRFIAFTSDVGPTPPPEGPKARIIDHLFARHWTQWKEGKRTHIFVQAVSGGAPRDVTPFDSDWPSFRLGGGDDFQFGPDALTSLAASLQKNPNFAPAYFLRGKIRAENNDLDGAISFVCQQVTTSFNETAS